MENGTPIINIPKACPLCGKTHKVEERSRFIQSTMNGVEITYRERFYVCPNAPDGGNEFKDVFLENENLHKARCAYIIAKHKSYVANKKMKYPEYIMKDVRQHLGLDEDDTSMDSEIDSLSRSEILNVVCDWNGFVGCAYRIKSWIEDIYQIKLSD